jgi:GTP-sensing pleiotropic transcriptional regulator CodY
MESRYDESAKRLAAQKKQRMRVTRRRKIVNNLTAGALVVGLSVGFAFMFVNAWDKEFEANQQMVAEYRAENYRPQISDEEKAQADKEYVEDHYSAQTIDGLKASTINVYGHLIDAIVDNEKLQVTSNI